jgi:hypothetical protein
MGDEIVGLPSTAAVRPTDREMPRRDNRGSARRREPSPKKATSASSSPESDGEPRQVGTKLDVRG